MMNSRQDLLRNIFLFIINILLFNACSVEPDTNSSNKIIITPILLSAPNFRDLAGISENKNGSGFVNKTSDGGIMRVGLFYRSSPLNNLNKADLDTLSGLKIYRIIDLRTPDEIYGQSNAQDIIPEGAIWTNINIYGTQKPIPSPFWGTPSEAISFMESGYRAFVTDSIQCKAFREILLMLSNDPGPVLWHCSGGKDRTGWTAVLLQCIAGIKKDVIMQDYLASNTYLADLIKTTKDHLIAKIPEWNTETIDALLGVKSSYLEAGFDQINKSYSNMSNYLTQGLGLSIEDINRLHAKMVIYSK